MSASASASIPADLYAGGGVGIVSYDAAPDTATRRPIRVPMRRAGHGRPRHSPVGGAGYAAVEQFDLLDFAEQLSPFAEVDRSQKGTDPSCG
jgi:hypothetical protein